MEEVVKELSSVILYSVSLMKVSSQGKTVRWITLAGEGRGEEYFFLISKKKQMFTDAYQSYIKTISSAHISQIYPRVLHKMKKYHLCSGSVTFKQFSLAWFLLILITRINNITVDKGGGWHTRNLTEMMEAIWVPTELGLTP